MTHNIETITKHYLIAALWSSTGDDCEPLDASHGIEDIAPETVTQAHADVAAFVTSAGSLLDGLNDEQTGHDFWLTRNGHGAGFWDRGLGDVGEQLTSLCEHYGSIDLYVGDDGRIYG